MRRARDNGLLKTENGKVCAINLGADYTAEHEWGIKDLRAAFGMKEKGLLKPLYGIDKRIAHEIPTVYNYHTNQRETAVKLIDTKKHTVLIVGAVVPEKLTDKELGHFELGRYKFRDEEDTGLKTSWDGKSFGVNAVTEEDRQAVRDVYEAIMGGDFACWVGGGGVFQNGGLILAIVSRLPADKLKVMRDADLDREALEKAAEKTGIAKRLKEAGKNWFALSPAWNKPKKDNTKHDVIFWLNPMQQDIHNFGWFTVEDLELWAKNEGPCMGGRNERR